MERWLTVFSPAVAGCADLLLERVIIVIHTLWNKLMANPRSRAVLGGGAVQSKRVPVTHKVGNHSAFPNNLNHQQTSGCAQLSCVPALGFLLSPTQQLRNGANNGIAAPTPGSDTNQAAYQAMFAQGYASAFHAPP